ncbi:DNA repair protein RecO [Chryseobacterium sp.]|uniref:DNA repair protein RecO n=1 Tax=Chryseobacterium sp. TaxID=1871047 RepID=UPI0025BB8AC9|nr:DNA repair protein RecO [Chryseobacterium sp.]
MNSQNGFLLSFIKYGENDAILHCFTEEDGFQSYFFKGIYTQKNKKKALLLPFHKLAFYIKPLKGNGIHSLSKLELLKSHEIYNDIKNNTVVFFISDFLNQVLKNENKNPHIFRGIEEFILELESQNYQSHLIFMIKLLEIQGVAPLISDHPYLDPETGNFNSVLIHQLFGEDISAIWKLIISSPDPYSVKIPSALRKNFLDSILVYYHYHITDFKIPASLEVIQQIFE